MFSDAVQKRCFCLLTGLALSFCLAAGPAQAKKHAEDTSDRGGLFQPPSPIARPLVLDTSIPKVSSRKGDELRQNAPDAATITPAVTPAVTTPAPAARANGIVPIKAFEPTKSIDSLRLHSLFE